MTRRRTAEAPPADPLSTVRWLTLDEIEPWVWTGGIPMDARGFFAAYNRAGGDKRAMSKSWLAQRERFVHAAMVDALLEPARLFRPDGKPTELHRTLIGWAYSPHPNRLARIAATLDL